MRTGPHYLRTARKHPSWTTLMSMAKGDSRRQQFGLQFLGSAWSKMAAQERLDLARLYIEKISQDLRVVPLPGQPWFQSINILGEHIFDHIRAHRFLADLVSFLEGTRQIVFELQRRREFFAHRSKC